MTASHARGAVLCERVSAERIWAEGAPPFCALLEMTDRFFASRLQGAEWAG
jgi:hypothetical protein